MDDIAELVLQELETKEFSDSELMRAILDVVAVTIVERPDVFNVLHSYGCQKLGERRAYKATGASTASATLSLKDDS